jgi:hypothetical protein
MQIEEGKGRVEARLHGSQSAQNGLHTDQQKRRSLRKFKSAALRGVLNP